MSTEPTRIEITGQHTIQAGPELQFRLNPEGSLTFQHGSNASLWANMTIVDPKTKNPVPLTKDSAGGAPYYEGHWPALINLESKRKKGPIIKLIKAGHGHWRGPPQPNGSFKPVAFHLLDNVFTAKVSERELQDAFMGTDYRNLQHENQTLLDRALSMRLFNLAETLWSNGVRPSKTCLDLDWTLARLADPIVYGKNNSLLEVMERLAGPQPKLKGDYSSEDIKAQGKWQKTAASMLFDETKKWITRLEDYGFGWNLNYSIIMTETGMNKVSMDLHWVALLHHLRLDNYNKVNGKDVEMPRFTMEQRKEWVDLWMEFLPRISAEKIMADTCKIDDQAMNIPTFLRFHAQDRQPELAAELEERALREMTREVRDDADAAKHRQMRL